MSVQANQSVSRVDSSPFDRSRAEAFGQRVAESMNGAAIALMISLGHKAGLFRTLAQLPPATSEEIALAAGLHERYVREWLGAMVTGRVVEYDAGTATYFLPAEHAASLVSSPGGVNLAVTVQFAPLLARVEDDVLHCFRHGGGVPYENFHGFHDVMQEESSQSVVAGLEAWVLPLVAGLEERLERGIDVLDVGCGQGRAMMTLAARFPRSRFAGYDLSPEAVAEASAEAKRRGLSNVRFEARDVTRLGELRRYGLITAFDAIHDQKAPAAVLSEIQAALRTDGVFLMQDIAASSHLERNLSHPLAPFLYTISCMHCMTVSLAQGGAGLGTVWGEELAVSMLGDAGFARVEVHRLPHDIQNNWYVARL
jgi:2-polyprenyl-3-methyl-5-hydroxy-6-metoxy-1,4-benzoquinol methylase